jgi:hypothetical protein
MRGREQGIGRKMSVSAEKDDEKMSREERSQQDHVQESN